MEHSDIQTHALKSVAYSEDVVNRPLHTKVLAHELHQIGEPDPDAIIEGMITTEIVGINKYGYLYMVEAGRDSLFFLE